MSIICWSVSGLGSAKSINDFCSFAFAFSLSQDSLDQSNGSGEGFQSFIFEVSLCVTRAFTSPLGTGLYYIYLIHVTRFCVKDIISVSSDWVELVVAVETPSPNFTWGAFSGILVWFWWGGKLEHCALFHAVICLELSS